MVKKSNPSKRHRKKGAGKIEAAIDEALQDSKMQALVNEVALSFFDNLGPDELEAELQEARRNGRAARVMLRVCAARLHAGRELPAPVGQYLSEILFSLAEQPLGGVLGVPEKDGAPPYSDLALLVVGRCIDLSSGACRGSDLFGGVADELGVDERTARRYYKQYKARGLDKFKV